MDAGSRKLSSIAILGSVFATLIACGGGGGGTGDPYGSVPTAQLITEGTTQLNMFIDDVASRTLANLNTNRQRFEAAAARSDNTANGNAGAAIMCSAQASQDVIDTFGFNRSESNKAMQAFAKYFGAGQIIGGAPKLWSLEPNDVLPTKIIGATMGSAQSSSREYPFSPTHAQLVASLERAEQLLIRALGYATSANVPTDASPMVVANWNGTGTVKIGTVEVRALQTGIRTALAAINIALAYDVNPTGAPIDYWTKSLAAFGFGSTATPSNYLPTSNFGNLRSNGAARLRQALEYLRNAVTSAEAGVTSYNTRQASSQIGFAIETSASSTTFATELNKVKSYLNAAQQKTVQYRNTNGAIVQQAVEINVPGFFTNPPTSLRATCVNFGVSVQDTGITLTGISDYTGANLRLANLLANPLPSTAFHPRQSTFNAASTGYQAVMEAGFLNFDYLEEFTILDSSGQQ